MKFIAKVVVLLYFLFFNLFLIGKLSLFYFVATRALTFNNLPYYDTCSIKVLSASTWNKDPIILPIASFNRSLALLAIL